MNRRNAIKNTALFFGYTLTGSVLLTSCEAAPSSEQVSGFLSKSHVATIAALADTILPRTDTPSATDVQVEKFLDLVVLKQFTPESQKEFTENLTAFENNFQKKYNLSSSQKGNAFTKAKPEERVAYLEELEKAPHHFRYNIWGADVGEDLPVPFYRSLKGMIIWAYFSSEEVGRNHLNYVPVPGHFKGCVPLAEIGNAWTLG